jgi:hypothetical protein
MKVLGWTLEDIPMRYVLPFPVLALIAISVVACGKKDSSDPAAATPPAPPATAPGGSGNPLPPAPNPSPNPLSSLESWCHGIPGAAMNFSNTQCHIEDEIYLNSGHYIGNLPISTGVNVWANSRISFPSGERQVVYIQNGNFWLRLKTSDDDNGVRYATEVFEVNRTGILAFHPADKNGRTPNRLRRRNCYDRAHGYPIHCVD